MQTGDDAADDAQDDDDDLDMAEPNDPMADGEESEVITAVVRFFLQYP